MTGISSHRCRYTHVCCGRWGAPVSSDGDTSPLDDALPAVCDVSVGILAVYMKLAWASTQEGPEKTDLHFLQYRCAGGGLAELAGVDGGILGSSGPPLDGSGPGLSEPEPEALGEASCMRSTSD